MENNIHEELEAINLNIYYGARLVVEDFSHKFAKNKVTAIIGDSGCGKSTVLRTLCRMHELTDGASLKGTVLLNGENIYAKHVDARDIRRQIGLIFQTPNPFDYMTIRDNVLSGFYLNNGIPVGMSADQIVKDALKAADLWDEVKNRLDDSSNDLSGGQRQRLCVARSVACNPLIYLFDEPTASLDPEAVLEVEDQISKLAVTHTVVLVTHNILQVERLKADCIFMEPLTVGPPGNKSKVGRVAEKGSFDKVIYHPDTKVAKKFMNAAHGRR